MTKDQQARAREICEKEYPDLRRFIESRVLLNEALTHIEELEKKLEIATKGLQDIDREGCLHHVRIARAALEKLK
jgi:hypothetical protein